MRPVFPPKPKGKIMPGELDEKEASGLWVAQRKFNGQHVYVTVPADREVQVLNRDYGTVVNVEPLLLRQLQCLKLQSGVEYGLDGEFMDAKTKNPIYKGKIILYDVLWVGDFLFGKPTLEGRLKMLNTICRRPKTLEPANGLAYTVTDDVWMAETFRNNFFRHWGELNHLDEIEGLVLKLADSVLTDLADRPREVDWMVRCRKPHSGRNYRF